MSTHQKDAWREMADLGLLWVFDEIQPCLEEIRIRAGTNDVCLMIFVDEGGKTASTRYCTREVAHERILSVIPEAENTLEKLAAPPPDIRDIPCVLVYEGSMWAFIQRVEGTLGVLN